MPQRDGLTEHGWTYKVGDVFQVGEHRVRVVKIQGKRVMLRLEGAETEIVVDREATAVDRERSVPS